MNSPGWANMFVDFTAIYTSAQDDSGYALDASGDIYYFDGSSGSWSWLSGPSSNVIVSISASVDGSLTAVDDTGVAFIYSSGSWGTITTSVLSASIGDADHYIVTSTSGVIVQYSNGASRTLSTGPTKISTTSGLAQIYGVDATGKVYFRNGSAWTVIAGKTLQQIDVSLSSTGTVQICGVDASGNGWTYNGTVWSSITKPPGVTQLASLEAGAGYIWATDSNGAVYRGSI